MIDRKEEEKEITSDSDYPRPIEEAVNGDDNVCRDKIKRSGVKECKVCGWINWDALP